MIRNRQGYANAQRNAAADARRKAATDAMRTCPNCGKRSLWRGTMNYGTMAYLRCSLCDLNYMGDDVEQIWSDAE